MIVAGFGFRKGADCASLQSALEQAAKGSVVTAFAAPEDKAQSPCLTDIARATGLPVLPVSAPVLAATQTPTQSAHSLARRDTGSVAEAAALAAAGPGARLLSSRCISHDRLATCAVAIRGPS